MVFYFISTITQEVWEATWNKIGKQSTGNKKKG